jgi:hypothetical protein
MPLGPGLSLPKQVPFEYSKYGSHVYGLRGHACSNLAVGT